MSAQVTALAEKSARALVSVLTDLAGFFDRCHGPLANAVNDHFDDLAAADWVPIPLTDHAQALTAALDTAGCIADHGTEYGSTT